MKYFRAAVAAVGIVASIATAASPNGCSKQDIKNNSSRTHTINEDDGTHVFGDFGKFRYGKNLSPVGAGIACQWRVTVQNQGKPERQIDHGNYTTTVLVAKPTRSTTIVRLYSRGCGRWE